MIRSVADGHDSHVVPSQFPGQIHLHCPGSNFPLFLQSTSGQVAHRSAGSQGGLQSQEQVLRFQLPPWKQCCLAHCAEDAVAENRGDEAWTLLLTTTEVRTTFPRRGAATLIGGGGGGGAGGATTTLSVQSNPVQPASQTHAICAQCETPLVHPSFPCDPQSGTVQKVPFQPFWQSHGPSPRSVCRSPCRHARCPTKRA